MMNRILAISIAAILAGTLSANAQSSLRGSSAGRGQVSKADVASARSTLATGSARGLLRKRVSEVDWDEAPLEDVVEWIRDQGEEKTNILFRWAALNNDGIDGDSPVTMKLRNTTVGEVLVELMDQLSPTGGVTFHGIDNRLTVSTKADLNRKLHVRVYEVTDILFQIPDFGRSGPVVDLDKAARSGGGSGGGQSIFSGSGGSNTEDLEEDEQEVEERIDSLRELIAETIAPDSWDLDGSGGGTGRIRVFDRRYLVVRNTMEVHEELVGYFSLRE